MRTEYYKISREDLRLPFPFSFSLKVKCNIDTFLIAYRSGHRAIPVSRANRYSAAFNAQWIRLREPLSSLIVNNLEISGFSDTLYGKREQEIERGRERGSAVLCRAKYLAEMTYNCCLSGPVRSQLLHSRKRSCSISGREIPEREPSGLLRDDKGRCPVSHVRKTQPPERFFCYKKTGDWQFRPRVSSSARFPRLNITHPPRCASTFFLLFFFRKACRSFPGWRLFLPRADNNYFSFRPSNSSFFFLLAWRFKPFPFGERGRGIC